MTEKGKMCVVCVDQSPKIGLSKSPLRGYNSANQAGPRAFFYSPNVIYI